MARLEHQACLLLGSNIDPQESLARAVAHLQRRVDLLQISSVWQSEAVGSSGPDFLNCAVLATTPLDADALKETVLRPLEAELGRVRTSDKNAPRTIDVDIILFDGVLFDPALWELAHLAVPIAELLPDYRSSSGESLREVARRLARGTRNLRQQGFLSLADRIAAPATTQQPEPTGTGVTRPVVTQLLPQQKQLPLKGLYLKQNLQEPARALGHSLVLADFITDVNGVIAVTDKPGHFRLPVALRNDSDWGLFQELMAQADVVISSGSYFRRLAAGPVQDILFQFEPGHPFAWLGDWRQEEGFASRRPDLAVVSRRLDFSLPANLLADGRKVTLFTTDAAAESDDARALERQGALVVGCGRRGVDGNLLISTLEHQPGTRVIMNASGPGVLEMLLAAQRLDLLYVTQVQRALPVSDATPARTLFSTARQVTFASSFRLTHEIVHEGVMIDDGSRATQRYLRYDRRANERKQPA